MKTSSELNELKAQLCEAQRQRDLLKNAFFVAQSENLPVAGSLLNDDIEEDSIDQKFEIFLMSSSRKKKSIKKNMIA